MYAVIMAGGGGTRLWPLSRGSRPKPFLPLLDGGRTLLAATVERLAPLVAPEHVYVVTEARHAGLVLECAPALPPRNILAEPSGRNTAAAVALAAHAVERAADEVMVVLPADQAIGDEVGFRAALMAAAGRAAAGDMVTLGVEPRSAKTGYGYVLAEGEPLTVEGRATYRVARFEEKPSLVRAEELLARGGAYWNAGTFVWRRDVLLDGLARHAADISAPIAERLAAHSAPAPDAGADDDRVEWLADLLAETYASLRATSIDYALLEPASAEARVAVVPMSAGWSDLGSWSALRDARAVGSPGRVVSQATPPAQIVDVRSRDVLVHASGGRLVAVVGLADVIVVDTPEALLVCSADAAQDVREVVERLRAEGRTDLL
ncbi:mannose-1-phosphate guanylyltransferase [soil metagenome]